MVYFWKEETASERSRLSQDHTEGNWEGGHEHISSGSKVKSLLSSFSGSLGRRVQALQWSE